MPSVIGKQVDEITRGAFAAQLKAHGYRKKGRAFHRRSDASVCVVNVQASQSNVGSTGTFTINLGVYFPTIEVPITGGARSDLPSEPECTLRQRLGGLMPGTGGDCWWSATVGCDIDAVSREVAELWLGFGRPWLDTNATLSGALPSLKHRDELRAAVAPRASNA